MHSFFTLLLASSLVSVYAAPVPEAQEINEQLSPLPMNEQPRPSDDARVEMSKRDYSYSSSYGGGGGYPGYGYGNGFNGYGNGYYGGGYGGYGGYGRGKF